MSDKAKRRHSTRRIKVIVVPKVGGKEIEFRSISQASEFIGISNTQLSRIFRGDRPNSTKFHVTEVE